jgi:hypothetical protein
MPAGRWAKSGPLSVLPSKGRAARQIVEITKNNRAMFGAPALAGRHGQTAEHSAAQG